MVPDLRANTSGAKRWDGSLTLALMPRAWPRGVFSIGLWAILASRLSGVSVAVRETVDAAAAAIKTTARCMGSSPTEQCPGRLRASERAGPEGARAKFYC